MALIENLIRDKEKYVRYNILEKIVSVKDIDYNLDNILVNFETEEDKKNRNMKKATIKIIFQMLQK